MYRIYNDEHWIIDLSKDKTMIKLSYFENNHFKEEIILTNKNMLSNELEIVKNILRGTYEFNI